MAKRAVADKKDLEFLSSDIALFLMRLYGKNKHKMRKNVIFE